MHSRPSTSSPGEPQAAPTSFVAPQQVLVDEYELIRPLGSGTMGQVFLAQDLVLDRRVAVKFISQESPSPTLRERFLVEARAIARLQHPNVVSIYRVGVVNGRPYLASEFVRGRSLEKVQLPMSWRDALDIATQLARGLAAAHQQGIVHRDLKPASVTRDGDGPESLRESPFPVEVRCGVKR
jgi:serine/threonine protein kinase